MYPIYSKVKALKGNMPANVPSLENDTKLTIATPQKYSNITQYTTNNIKSFGVTLNFIYIFPNLRYIVS